jgi:hypothetical protein
VYHGTKNKLLNAVLNIPSSWFNLKGRRLPPLFLEVLTGIYTFQIWPSRQSLVRNYSGVAQLNQQVSDFLHPVSLARYSGPFLGFLNFPGLVMEVLRVKAFCIHFHRKNVR